MTLGRSHPGDNRRPTIFPGRLEQLLGTLGSVQLKDAIVERCRLRADELAALPDGYSMRDYTRTGHWSDLSEDERRLESRKMEIYAAMIEHLDVQVGRIVSYLKESGQFDNTYIIFMSDNGGDASVRPERDEYDNSLDNIGRASSYVGLGAWGDVITAPFKWNKGRYNEGGIRVPGFVFHRSNANSGGTEGRFLTILDVFPTVLDLAGVEHPGDNYQGRSILVPRGNSFMELLRGNSMVVDRDDIVAGWFQSALYANEWKLVRASRRGSEDWELYNIVEDPSETVDLAGSSESTLQELVSGWTRIAEETGLQ